MHPQILAYAVLVLLEACSLNAFPVYPEIDSTHDFNMLDNLAGFVPDDVPSAALHPSLNLNSALSAPEGGGNQMQQAGQRTGGKESPLDETPENLVEDVKAILWKLAAADKLRSQAFVKTEQSPQKPSKRACFWKYCVTN
ncbi:uncharacterized protein LOC143823192 [Paroedura picta]|uniref:uncharacterized protein LOC143823192 n=1 Tax=Paroedura picta TaxID=143630 RepID=UPI00405673E6